MKPHSSLFIGAALLASALVRLYAAAMVNPVPEKPLKSILSELKINPKTIRIVVDKSDYELSLWSGQTRLKTYPVVLGTSPVKDKRMEGDRCTPEGTFHIRAMYPHKSWSKFIWFDYPTTDSWQKFNTAKRQGLIPQNATIGGDIGIHGVPDGADYIIDQRQNWTWGCISLKNKDLAEVYSVTATGTELQIRQ